MAATHHAWQHRRQWGAGDHRAQLLLLAAGWLPCHGSAALLLQHRRTVAEGPVRAVLVRLVRHA